MCQVRVGVVGLEGVFWLIWVWVLSAWFGGWFLWWLMIFGGVLLLSYEGFLLVFCF